MSIFSITFQPDETHPHDDHHRICPAERHFSIQLVKSSIFASAPHPVPVLEPALEPRVDPPTAPTYCAATDTSFKLLQPLPPESYNLRDPTRRRSLVLASNVSIQGRPIAIFACIRYLRTASPPCMLRASSSTTCAGFSFPRSDKSR